MIEGLIRCEKCIERVTPCDKCRKRIHETWHANGMPYLWRSYCSDKCPGRVVLKQVVLELD